MDDTVRVKKGRQWTFHGPSFNSKHCRRGKRPKVSHVNVEATSNTQLWSPVGTLDHWGSEPTQVWFRVDYDPRWHLGSVGNGSPEWACTTSGSVAASCAPSLALVRTARTPALAFSPRRFWVSPAWRLPRSNPSLPNAPAHHTAHCSMTTRALRALPESDGGFNSSRIVTSILLIPPIPLPP